MTNQQLAYKIAEDLERFDPYTPYRDKAEDVNLRNPSGDPDGEFRLSIGFRELGSWISDPEEEFDEDDDNRIWDDGEYSRFETKFKSWVLDQSWWDKDRMDVEVHTGEKDWAYFTVVITKQAEKPAPAPADTVAALVFQIFKLLADLYDYEYDRMTSSGREVLDTLTEDTFNVDGLEMIEDMIEYEYDRVSESSGKDIMNALKKPVKELRSRPGWKKKTPKKKKFTAKSRFNFKNVTKPTHELFKAMNKAGISWSNLKPNKGDKIHIWNKFAEEERVFILYFNDAGDENVFDVAEGSDVLDEVQIKGQTAENIANAIAKVIANASGSESPSDVPKDDYVFTPELNPKAKELVDWLEIFGFKNYENAGVDNTIRMYSKEKGIEEAGYTIQIFGASNNGLKLFIFENDRRHQTHEFFNISPYLAAQSIWRAFNDFMVGFDLAQDGFEFDGVQINYPFMDTQGSPLNASPMEYYGDALDKAPMASKFYAIPQAEELISKRKTQGYYVSPSESTKTLDMWAKVFEHKSSLFTDNVINSDWLNVDPFLSMFPIKEGSTEKPPLFIDGLVPLDVIESIYENGTSEDYEAELGRKYAVGDFIYDAFEGYKEFLVDNEGETAAMDFEDNDALIESAKKELESFWNRKTKPSDCKWDMETINQTTVVLAFVIKHGTEITNLEPRLYCLLTSAINKLAKYELCPDEAPPAPSKPKAIKFVIHWSEGGDFDMAEFKTWAAFQKALETIEVAEGGLYNKTKIEVEWSNGKKIVDRVDIGDSEHDYDPTKKNISEYLKDRDGVMYESNIDKGTRDTLSWTDKSEKPTPRAKKSDLKAKLAKLKAKK